MIRVRRLASRGFGSALAILCLGVVASCADLSSVQQLSNGIAAKYRTAAQVNLRGREHLTILVRLTSQVDTSDGGEARLARDIATFAKQHSPNANQLVDIDVAYVGSLKIDTFTVTRVSPPYHFLTSQLP